MWEFSREKTMMEEQLEFQGAEGWPASERLPRARRCNFSMLSVMTQFCHKKYKVGLSDLDILVLVVLARSPHPLRFHRVRDACSGGSQTGVWNSLERLADRDYVAVSGKPGGHRYWIAETGVVKLKYLSDR
jgi:hypothetical protein